MLDASFGILQLGRGLLPGDRDDIRRLLPHRCEVAAISDHFHVEPVTRKQRLSTRLQSPTAERSEIRQLPSHHVLDALVVFDADKLEHLRVWQQPRMEDYSPRFRVGFGIAHDDFEVHVSEIAPLKMFGHAQRVSGGMAVQVEPRIVLEPGRIDR